MRWLPHFGEPSSDARRQGDNRATGLCAAILTACGFYLEAIRLVFLVEGLGLDLPGHGDTPDDPFAKPDGPLAARQQ
jgi:hypothetical protein